MTQDENAEELPPHLQAEAEAIVGEVYAAFRGVSREGGVSWSESRSLDGRGIHPWPLEVARTRDRDLSWEELVDGPDWSHGPDSAWGGWCFLDAVGFRYYLPAAMVRVLRGSEGGCETLLDFTLTLHPSTSTALTDYQLEKWSAFDPEQRRCVARFLRHRIDGFLARGWDHDARSPQAALASYWGGFA